MSYAGYDSGRPSQFRGNAYTSRQLVGAYGGMGSYEDMTLYELKDEARKRGISGFANAREPELIEALENDLDEVPFGMRNQGYKHEHHIGHHRVGAYGGMGGSYENMTLYELKDIARGKVPYSHKTKAEIIKELKKYDATGHAPGYRVGAMPKTDLNNLTVAQLKEYARQHDISGFSKLRKAELIKKIEGHMKVGCAHRVGKSSVSSEVKGFNRSFRVPGVVDYDSMSTAELRDLAEMRGVPGYYHLNRDDLIHALQTRGQIRPREVGGNRKVGCACSR